MKSALDTNVLVDIFLPDSIFLDKSKAILDQQYNKGSLLISEIVYAELNAIFPSRSLLDQTLGKLHINFVSSDIESAYLSGSIFKNCRKEGGTRQRVIADFMIGGHALRFADCLVTRDRGFYRTYFKNLMIVTP